MMPKGVEHMVAVPPLTVLGAVKIPMMPKGVEHPNDLSAFNAEACEDSNDAERR